MSDGSDFVTVAQASKALNVPDRRVRRHVAKLTVADRRTSVDGLQLVRLSALARSIHGERVSSNVIVTPTVATVETSDTDRHPDRQGVEAELRTQIADKDGEIMFLREALTRAQENEHRALTELAKAREQSAILIAATAGAFNAQRIAPSDTEQGGTVPEGVSAPPRAQESESAPIEDYSAQNTPDPAPPWWRPGWLFGKPKEGNR